MPRLACCLYLLLMSLFSSAMAGEFDATIDMHAKGGATFYVAGQISGVGAVEWMVDTGSGYMTINEEMLVSLKNNGQARFVKDLRGRLANGSEIEVPVYNIQAVRIGATCWLRNVEAAVFPGKTRPILGLNVLQRAAPFIFSFEPPRLVLSHCVTPSGPDSLAALKR